MRRPLVAALLLAPAAAWADPGTIAFILASSIEIGAIVITVQQLLVVALYVYGSARARRTARSAMSKARAEYNANLQDRNITALQALPPWRIVVGRAWVGCDIHAIFTTDKSGYREDGTAYTRPDALKHLVVVFADHKCKALHDLAIDGVPLGALDGSGFVTAGSEFYLADTDSRTATIGGGGSVTVGQPVIAVLNAATGDANGYGDSSSLVDVTGSITLSGGNLTINGPAGATVNYTVDSSVATVRVQKHLGSATQTVDTYLNSVVPSEWTSTDRLIGKCYAVVTLDLENQRFQGGQIGITADVSGLECYDPRNDSTVAGGSGAHRANDPATWEWTDNAAIAGARHYLQAEWGFDNDPADIDEAYTQAAATACDVRISASVQAHSQAFTVDAATNEIIFAADELYGVGDGVRVSSSGTLPGGLAAATSYYVIRGDFGLKRYKLATTVANAYAGTAIDITSAGSGTHTCTWHDYAAYKVNGAFTTEGGQKEAILDDLATAMAGDAVYGAQWQILAGAWTTPITLPGGGGLVDDDLAGQISIVQADTPLDQLVNGVRGSYIATGKAVPTEFGNYSNATFVADDGAELWADLPLEYVDNPARARNLARILVETSRNGQIIQYPAKLRAWPVQVGDRIHVTSAEYGLDKDYRVTDWQFGITAPVVLTLQEDTAAAWDAADAAVSDQTLNTGLPSPWVVQALTLGTLTSGAGVGIYTSSGAWVPRIRVPWSALTGAYLADGSGYVLVRWRAPGYTEWQEVRPQSSETAVHISGFRDGDPVVIEAYAVNGLGQPGPSSFVVHTVAITGNGLVGGGNLLANSGFEVDSNADGVADSWLAFSSGTTGTVTNTTPTSGMRGSKAQRVDCTALGTTPGTDRIGIEQALVQLGSLAGTKVAVSCAFSASAQTDMQIQLVWKTSGGSTISTDTFTAPNPASLDLRRVAFTATVPATCTQADLYAWVTPQTGRASSACAALWDDVQLQSGAVPTDWAPRADEILAGAVTTPALAPDARGVRRVVTPGSSVTVTEVTHVPDGYSFKTVLAADSQFTAPYNGKAVVTFEGNVSMSASASTTEFLVGNTDATYTGIGLKQTGTNPFASTHRFAVSTTRSFDLTAGSNYTFKAVASKWASGETISFDEMQMVVEITYTG